MDTALPIRHRPAEHRVERECEVCGKWDRAPRHLYTDDNGQDHPRHLDCCAAAGCPAPDGHPGHCGVLLEHVGHKKDDALVAALTALSPLHFAPDEHEARRLHRLRDDVTDKHLSERLTALRAEG